VTCARGSAQVAFRGTERLALRLQPARPDSWNFPGPTWRVDSSYLITGGLGGVGLHLAGALADLGARRLVLMGRNTLPPRSEWTSVDPETRTGRQIAAVRALESRGVSVHLLRADVADEADLARALGQYAREGWPAIKGVVHAAGTA